MPLGICTVPSRGTGMSFRVWVCAAQAAKRTTIRTLVFTVVTPLVPPHLGSARYYFDAGPIARCPTQAGFASVGFLIFTDNWPLKADATPLLCE